MELRKAPNFKLLEGDLNLLDLPELLRDRDWIFHQAAQAGVRTSWGKSFEVYTRSNIDATQKLLDAAVNQARLQRFVFASSSSVYGNAARLPVSEEAPTNPISPYGVTKLAAEHLCLLYAQSFQVPTVSLRYFTVYGPRQRPDMAFHRFGRALLRGEGFRVYGNGTQTRDFTFVSDVVQANLDAAAAANVEGKVLNIAGGSRVSLTDAIAVLEELTGREALVRYEDKARGDVGDTYADISLARRLIGYRPKVTLLEGLKSQLEYLRALYLPKESAPVR
jgi:UDP-glucose 4-epimerase